MRTMPKKEWWEFAALGTKTGKLAVVRTNGMAHVTPVWFALNATAAGDEIIFTTGANSLKSKALRRDNRFSLCVDDQRPPYSYVYFTAEAHFSEDLDELKKWATIIGGRYMGGKRSAEFGERNAVAGECLIRARITKVIAEAAVAD